MGTKPRNGASTSEVDTGGDGNRRGTVTMNVVRVAVKGWTWVCGEADNTTRAKRMLLEALDAEGSPRKQVDVTITAGGFIRVSFPRTYDSKGGVAEDPTRTSSY